MIIPFILQKTCKASSTPETYMKWYVFYHEIYLGEKFCRYLTQDGWKKCCPKYFDSSSEAMAVFQKYNQTRLLVTKEEYLSEMDYRRDYLEMMYQDSLNDLQELFAEKEI